MARIHHTAICCRDVEASKRFWCDAMGLVELMDMPFEGDWPTLFGAPSTTLRSIFLGQAGDFDSGIIELVVFDPAPADPDAADADGDGADSPAPSPSDAVAPPASGFFLVSLTVDVDEVLARLADLGLGGDQREVTVAGVRLVVVTDPDGVLVELMDHQAKANLDKIHDQP